MVKSCLLIEYQLSAKSLIFLESLPFSRMAEPLMGSTNTFSLLLNYTGLLLTAAILMADRITLLNKVSFSLLWVQSNYH